MSIVDINAQSIRKDKGIEFHDLTFFPLTVDDYTLFSSARQSFELLQSSLTPKLARLSWCSCLLELDKEASENGKQTQFLSSVLRVMAKALRLSAYYDNEAKQGMYPIRCATDEHGYLSAIIILPQVADTPIVLNMMDMDVVRKIISAQNDYEVPDEHWNPELLRAAKYKEYESGSSIMLDANLEDLVFSVALNVNCNPEDVWEWSIRKFNRMQKAIDRRLNYQIYSQAECSGMVKFTKGNPCPSWKFNREQELPSSFKSIDELDAGANGLLN